MPTDPTPPTAANPEHAALLALHLAAGVGATRLGRLLDRFGAATAIAAAAPEAIAHCLEVAPARAREWLAASREVDLRAEFARMAHHGATLLARGDPDYPPLLAAIPDPPPLLSVRGRRLAEATPTIAVVGTRRPTAYGIEQAGRFAAALAAAGVTIVSGGARGVDAAAHRAALRVGGATIVVLGSGVGCPYPPEHARLFDEVVEQGGSVISEFPTLTEPRPGHFPRRNRIISGLSLGVLVIEAGSRSGALVTARLAVEEHGREAMALPGRVDSPMSVGCLRAIREGWAAPVASLAEVLESLGESGAMLSRAVDESAPMADGKGIRALPPTASASQRRIVEVLDGDPPPRSIDALVAATGLEASQIMADLTVLRLRGAIAWCPQR